jgi:hypothetical protein
MLVKSTTEFGLLLFELKIVAGMLLGCVDDAELDEDGEMAELFAGK